MDEQELRKVWEMTDTLDQIAEDLKRMSGGDEFAEKLHTGWKSENADLFLKKHFRLKEEIRKTAEETQLAAETIREQMHQKGR